MLEVTSVTLGAVQENDRRPDCWLRFSIYSRINVCLYFVIRWYFVATWRESLCFHPRERAGVNAYHRYI